MVNLRETSGAFNSCFCCYFLELHDRASAVLSGSDEKNCHGFVKRQALYSCLTCAPEDAKNDFSKAIGEFYRLFIS
jgi:hypothetical protein